MARLTLDETTRQTLVRLTSEAKKLCIAPIDIYHRHGFILTPDRVDEIRAEALQDAADMLAKVNLQNALGSVYKSGAAPGDVKRALVQITRELAERMKRGEI